MLAILYKNKNLSKKLSMQNPNTLTNVNLHVHVGHHASRKINLVLSFSIIITLVGEIERSFET